MDERHSEALDSPDQEGQHGEGVFSVAAGHASRRRHKAHDDKSKQRNRKARGNRPFPADLVGKRARHGKAEYRHDTAHDRHDHRCAGSGFQIIDDIVPDIGSERVVRHKPQELRTEDRKQHIAVSLGHRLIVIDRCLDRSHLLAKLQLLLHLVFDLVLADREEQHERGDDHQNGRDQERQLNHPDIARFIR